MDFYVLSLLSDISNSVKIAWGYKNSTSDSKFTLPISFTANCYYIAVLPQWSTSTSGYSAKYFTIATKSTSSFSTNDIHGLTEYIVIGY